MNNKQNAFTLIELLIAVAITGILTAIALPNFLNAHTRATLSRVMQDHKTLSNAIELYRLDLGHLPPNCAIQRGCVFQTDWAHFITTPVAYHSGDLTDPFQQNRVQVSPYINGSYGYGLEINTRLDGTKLSRTITGYQLDSAGPDGMTEDDRLLLFPLPYLPTNGLSSRGDIVFDGNTRSFNFSL